MKPWDANLQGHKAAAFFATLGKPLKPVTLKAKGVFLRRTEFNHRRFSI